MTESKRHPVKQDSHRRTPPRVKRIEGESTTGEDIIPEDQALVLDTKDSIVGTVGSTFGLGEGIQRGLLNR